MVYPQNNQFRQVLDISGIWEIRFDPDDAGRDAGWASGVDQTRPVAVPASWNDQFAGDRDFLGPAWYQTVFDCPPGWRDRKISLRFGSVNYIADVWLNGSRLGSHEGGHLPFTFADIDLRSTGNRLVVRVDGRLSSDRVPPGGTPLSAEDMFTDQIANWPPTSFDFFPYCGIHRPVLLCADPPASISDLTVTTEIDGHAGVVAVAVETSGGDAVRVRISGHGADLAEEVALDAGGARAELRIPEARLWGPGHPNLYTLDITLMNNRTEVDFYTMPIGIRTIRVDGDRLLLNGEPVYLTGFGRHEDFPVVGRGLLTPLIVKDYDLMHWVGANSFRTSHYPYSEQMMQLADRLGVLVIDETPAVGLFFLKHGYDRRLALCKQYAQELIARDKNHPSVIMWSLANEPHSARPEAAGFFADLFAHARQFDSTRPFTFVSHKGISDAAMPYADVMCLNRYVGWYTNSGRLDDLSELSEEIDQLHQMYGKPFIMTEFGADTYPGHHAEPPEMFSEEYQVEFLKAYLDILDERAYVVGAHVWNMCDFKTSQAVRRMNGMNFKGVFTRDRRPKMAAHFLRERWSRKS